jgi:hypothetical protein
MKKPLHITILGLGPSLEEYINLTKRFGSRRALRRARARRAPSRQSACPA